MLVLTCRKNQIQWVLSNCQGFSNRPLRTTVPTGGQLERTYCNKIALLFVKKSIEIVYSEIKYYCKCTLILKILNCWQRLTTCKIIIKQETSVQLFYKE